MRTRKEGSGRRALLMALGACALLPRAQAATAPDCAALARLELPAASVLSAAPHLESSWTLPSGRKVATPRPFCRVVVSARPSADSDIRIEIWLPAEPHWNRRIWGVGNSTWAGYIPYRALATQVTGGYAAVGTDTGHQAKSWESAWAIGHPEKVIDYGHRGMHEAAVAAKRVAAAYYQRTAEHAYYGGCSTGGRHALMEAQRYPDDYDGIFAGDPDYDSTLFYAGIATMQGRWKADPARTLPPAKIPALLAAALAACDRGDGVADGIIENPQRCRPNLAALACKGKETDRCLTAPQRQTAQDIYDGIDLPGLQRRYDGFAVGSEGSWDWVHLGAEGPGSSDGYKEAMGFYRDLVFGDPGWTAARFQPERDTLLAERKLGPVLDANNPDLGRYFARGGKLILFQGWNDPTVSPYSTIRYYERVVAAAGAPVASRGVRLFMVPGMSHCGGGPGANQFGQFSAANGDARHNIGAALQRWVEQGVAPERIDATKLSDDDDPASKVVRTRPLCAYPASSRYRGSGSTNEAANFDCVMPD